MSRHTERAFAFATSRAARAALLAVALTACDAVAPPPPIGADAEDATTSTHDTRPSSDTRTANDTQAVDAAPSLASDPLWDPDHIPTFHLTIAATNWQKALWDLIPSDPCVRRPYLEGDLAFDNPQTGERETYAHVGVRWRGHSSLVITDPTIQRPGIKVSFDELEPGRRFHGEKKLDFMGTEGDYSLMHEVTAFGIARAAGLAVPNATYARIYVNDVLLGIYPFVEEGDDDPFLEQHFAGDDHGDFLEVDGYCGGQGRFDDVASDPALADRYEPKAHTEADAIARVVLPLVTCADINDDTTFRACVEPLLDVDEVLTEIAVDLAIANPDGFHGTGQNYTLYRPTTTGKVVVSPWDMDLAFAEELLAWPNELMSLRPLWADHDSPNALSDRLIAAYPQRLCEALDRVLALTDPAVLQPELDSWRVFLRPLIEEDPWMDVTQWLTAYLSIEHTVAHRHAVLRTAVDACLQTGTSL